MDIATLLAAVSAVAALSALAISAHTWAHAPGSRLWRELRSRIEDLEHDNELVHGKLDKRTKVENVTKATAVRTEKRQKQSSLLEDAEALLSGSQPGGGTAPAAAPASPTKFADEHAALAHYRRLGGIH